MIDSRYASRKFILAVFLLLAALGLLLGRVIDAATWERFCTFVLALYITGNVGTHFVTRGATKGA